MTITEKKLRVKINDKWFPLKERYVKFFYRRKNGDTVIFTKKKRIAFDLKLPSVIESDSWQVVDVTFEIPVYGNISVTNLMKHNAMIECYDSYVSPEEIEKEIGPYPEMDLDDHIAEAIKKEYNPEHISHLVYQIFEGGDDSISAFKWFLAEKCGVLGIDRINRTTYEFEKYYDKCVEYDKQVKIAEEAIYQRRVQEAKDDLAKYIVG